MLKSAMKSLSKDPRKEAYSFDELMQLVSEENWEEAIEQQRLAHSSPYEVSSVLERLDSEKRQAILRKLSYEDAADIIAEMDTEDSADILREMRSIRAKKIIEGLEPDDAVCLLRELRPQEQDRILSQLPEEVARTMRKLLSYDPHTAAGVMTPYVMTLRDDMSVDEAIHHIRREKHETENSDMLYVVDERKRLMGVTSVRDLIWSRPSQKISHLMHKELRGVCRFDQHKEEVARQMAELNFQNLPVVDTQGRLMGIVTHDDVIDILRDEATEDIQKLHGAGADENIHDPILSSVTKRMPWLMANLVIAFTTAKVISLFTEQITQLALLAVFMNLVSSLGGSAGAQTLAVAIRGLALGNLHTGDARRICRKELCKGLYNGLMIGLLTSFIAGLWTHNPMVGVVLFLAMSLNMGLAGLAGAFVPLFLQSLHFDPAQSSYIFLTSITDIAGVSIFLALGSKLLL
ncbi:MAG: magnesium transporter [Puniceicoccales bacterium]|jgi:magnesium transporter|nr:magnesium transporter [Puniceicoccales bacterium]